MHNRRNILSRINLEAKYDQVRYLLLLMIIMMRGRVAAHTFTADQLQQTLPRGGAPRHVVRAFRVLFPLPPDPRLPVHHPSLPVLSNLLATAAQSGSGTTAIPISPSATAPCNYACNVQWIF